MRGISLSCIKKKEATRSCINVCTEKKSVGKLRFSDTIDTGETVYCTCGRNNIPSVLLYILYHKKERKATRFFVAFPSLLGLY